MKPGSEVYPFRSFHTGKRGSLHVILKTLENMIDSFCSRTGIGFKLMVHAPYEFPVIRHRYYEISNDGSTDIFIKPKVILPTADLDTYGLSERKCFFQSERKLKFFKIYTQSNCRTECGWNHTLDKCGCATVGMPREYKT